MPSWTHAEQVNGGLLEFRGKEEETRRQPNAPPGSEIPFSLEYFRFPAERNRGDRTPLSGGQVMVARRLFIFFVVALFPLGIASSGISGVVGEEVKGTVTRIDGGKVSIKDFMGDEKTVEPKNPEALSNLKVGDRAMVKDGILTIEGGGVRSAPSPGPRY